MIFVILGTQDKQFTRLLQEIDVLISKGIIKQKVIVQAGTTKYQSINMEIHKMIPIKKFLNYIEESDYIITHGGVGSIIDGMKKNKKIIAVPRKKEYVEHENNHQMQIVEKFAKEKYIIGCRDVSDLKKAIQKVDTFVPKNCVLGNENMIELIKDYVENTSPSGRKNVMIYSAYVFLTLIFQFLFYCILRNFQGVLYAIGSSFIISYILLIVLFYQKRSYLFEILWCIVFTCILLICLDMTFYHVIPYFLITIVIDFISYFVHKLYNKRWSK